LDLIKNLGGNTVSEFLVNLETWQGVQTAKATGNYAASKLDLVNDKIETLRCLSETVITVADLENKINSLFKDKDDVKIPSVVCSTTHKAKGLEWNNVNLLSETFQSKRKGLTPDQVKEESNIYYVAITRARERLNLVSPAQGQPKQNKI
jgi:superfamily I DNA/RNA helicase